MRACRRALPASLLVLAFAWNAPGEDTWKNVERVVAIGDVHGDYGAFTSLLRGTGLIDSREKWSGGKTHLVQTGDMVDRGPDSRKVLDLLMALEKQADKADGAVHALIGNHEAMNLYGDLRYVAPGDFAAFRTENTERLRDLQYKQHVRELREKGMPEPGEDYKRKWMSAHPPGYFERAAAFAPDGHYGRWISGRNTAVRINDVVYLHGGISPKYAGLSLREINNRVRDELRGSARLEGGMAMDPEGPLWYRGLAQQPEADLSDHLAAALERLGAKYMVAAHTVTRGVTPRFGGRLIMIDVGLSQTYGSHPACLLIESGKWYAFHRGTRVELPHDMEGDLLRYRNQIAMLDSVKH